MVLFLPGGSVYSSLLNQAAGFRLGDSLLDINGFGFENTLVIKQSNIPFRHIFN